MDVAVLEASGVVQSAGLAGMLLSVAPDVWCWGDGARMTRSFEILSAIPSRMMVTVCVVTLTTGNGPTALGRCLW